MMISDTVDVSIFLNKSGTKGIGILNGLFGWTAKYIRHHTISMNNVSSHALAGLYSNARASIIASYSEGFSYSGIKAMRCETPIIASGIQAHREVYGDNAIFFDPYTSADLVDALNQITTTSDRELDKMTQTAFQFSMQYSEEPSRLGWENLFSRATQI